MERSAAVVAQLKAHKTRRSRAKAACTRANTFVDDHGDRVVSLIELKQRQIKFRECWQEFEEAQADIDLIEDSEEEIALNEEERVTFADKYFIVDAKIEEMIIARARANDVERGIGGGANPSPARHIMGDLPQPRVTPSRPFSSVGVDYCGPIYIREGKRRNAKRTKAWISIFICLATKAIHIELVSDLSTEGFLNALKRFIGRRGKPSDIYSDNGTNFVGTNRELEELRNWFNQEKVRNQIVNETSADAITWHFIPPRAPHFGGLWEAAVRSMKHHFNRTASDQSLTFEEAVTLLIEIEAILNSRPLTPMSPDPEDFSCLTPGHFLIGDSLISYPEPSLQHLPVNRLSRWQRIEQIRQHFWTRWSSDYLHNLQQRTKWKREDGPPLKLEQLVVVRETDQPPRSWLLGRIVEIHPGSDGVVRAASVQTAKGVFKRPAMKLCILPIETQP